LLLLITATSVLNAEGDSEINSGKIIVQKSMVRELVEEASPTVVNIRSLQKVPRFFGDFHFGMPGTPQQSLLSQFKKNAEGSGFILDKEGYIITTTHVVVGSDEVQVKLHDGRMFKGRLVGMDKVTDIALIKIDVPFELPFLKLGNSGRMQPGDWVLAIGSPFGLDFTVTLGIVSGKGRSLGNSPYDDYIQVDAPINPGNSGGPLINMEGEAVGVNAAIMSKGQGLGFSVPIDLVKTIYPQLKEKGRIVRSWLGVVVQEITLNAVEKLGLEVYHGSLVMNVLADSPAEKVGIRRFDVIVEFDGHPIKSSHEFPKRIAHTPAGINIPIKLMRENKVQTLEVMLEEVPEGGLR
jgi:serine protease Do